MSQIRRLLNESVVIDFKKLALVTQPRFELATPTYHGIIILLCLVHASLHPSSFNFIFKECAQH